MRGGGAHVICVITTTSLLHFRVKQNDKTQNSHRHPSIVTKQTIVITIYHET